jgi:hypothetical protein
MSWLILIGVLVFFGFVSRATNDVVSGGGSVDWMDTDDDDVSAWGDDDWLNDDIITSPVYSSFACNIWHDPFDDGFSFSSSSDDDWMWDNDD